MEENNLTKEELRDIYLEISDILIYKASKEKAKERIERVFLNDRVKNNEDFKYEISRESNDETGEEFEGLMFARSDWSTDLNGYIWSIKQVFEDIKVEDVEVEDGLMIFQIVNKALKKKGIVGGQLGTDTDYAIHYFVKEEDFEKVHALFKEAGADPLK